MHLQTGVLTPTCTALGLGAAAVGIGAAVVLARREGRRPDAAALGTAAAAVFAAQGLNLPVLPEVSGHVLGGFLLAYAFGAGWGMLAATAVLVVQSLLFADGGWLALGMNVTSMGVVPSLVVLPLWRAQFGRSTGIRRWASLAGGAWLSVLMASAVAGLAIASHPSSGGARLPLVGTIVSYHALIALIEAGFTVTAVALAAHAMHAAYRPIVAAMTTVLLAVGVLGASPWPDGLEAAAERHGVAPLTAGVPAVAESWQASLVPFADYAPLSILAGCVVALLAVVVREVVGTTRRSEPSC